MWHTIQPCMTLLFATGNFAELDGYLNRVCKRICSDFNGVDAIKAVSAGRDQVDAVAGPVVCRHGRSRMLRMMDALTCCVQFVMWPRLSSPRVCLP